MKTTRKKVASMKTYINEKASTDDQPNAETIESFDELDSGGGVKYNGSTEQLFGTLSEE